MKHKNRILAVILSVFLLGGCTGYEDDAEQDGLSFHVKKSGTKAFAAEYSWDVTDEETRIVIPDHIDKAEVTSLGGFFGTGVPAPFCIMGKDGTYEFNDNPYRSMYGAPLIFEEVPVTVVIPDTVTEVINTAGTGYYGSRNENGEIVFRRPAVRFECGEGSPAFTVQDGRLLEKESGNPVNVAEGLYEDDAEHEMTLRDRLFTRCVKDMGEEKEVYDFFPEFGRVFIQINSYMKDSEYMFTALELIPLEEGVLERTDTDTFDAEVRQFSDFAMAGQYTRPESPYYRVVAKDNYIGLIVLDENRNPVMDSGIELDRDMTQPSQFVIPKELLGQIIGETNLYWPVRYAWQKAVTHILEGDGVRVRMYRDGTFTIQKDAENTTVVYRGIAMCGYGADNSDLYFAVTKLGGTTEPHAGKVRMEVEEDTVTFTAADGYECEPLIPQGESELICRIS